MSDRLDPITDTRNGRLRGTRVGGALAFKGIRYARAERFQSPRQPESWIGMRDALEFGASAPQTNPSPPPGPPPIILPLLPRVPGAPPPVRLAESEDCLFLNVWTSGLRDGRKRPVMVWLHGGFFSSGSGSTVDGSALAARGDVVVVSLNHRVNAFGYTHLADIAGPDFAHSGNAGMLDIIAALEWVRDNIEAFGGDPKRVMAFGTSGGGMKTTFLTASPRTGDLIHRAAAQSGPALRFLERDKASEATERLLKAVGLGRNQVDDLRTMPTEKLLAGYFSAIMRPKNFTDLPNFAPVLDDELLPHHPFSPKAAPGVARIPMLIGSNMHEMTFFMAADADGFTLSEEGLKQRTEKLTGGRADSILGLYERLYPEASPSCRYIQLFSDYSIFAPTMAQAERRAAAGGAPVYAYRLGLETPALDGKLGSTHTIEMPLIFDTTAANPLTFALPGATDLAKRMSSAWVAFATNGDPNCGELSGWAPYQPDTRAVMQLGATCKSVERAEQAALDAWASLIEEA